MPFEKSYFEYFAKYHAEAALKLGRGFFHKSECPDFISPRGDTGMEVTRAAIEEWVRQEANLSRNFGASSPADLTAHGVREECENDPYNRDGQDVDDSGPLGLTPKEKSVHIARILERVKEKTNLLPTYRRYSHNWLYVFGETTGLNREDMRALGRGIARLKQSLRFERVLVKIGCGLYEFSEKGEQTEHRLTKRQLLRVHRKAKIRAYFAGGREMTNPE